MKASPAAPILQELNELLYKYCEDLTDVQHIKFRDAILSTLLSHIPEKNQDAEIEDGVGETLIDFAVELTGMRPSTIVGWISYKTAHQKLEYLIKNEAISEFRALLGDG